MFKVGDAVEIVANTEFPGSDEPDELIGLQGVVTKVYSDGYVAIDLPAWKGLLFAPDELELVQYELELVQ